MRKKPDINKCTIDYGDKTYEVGLRGDEDTDGAGGIWDLSKDFTEKLLMEFDTDILQNQYFERGAERVQNEIHRFLQYYVLYSLRQQLNSQNENEM